MKKIKILIVAIIAILLPLGANTKITTRANSKSKSNISNKKFNNLTKVKLAFVLILETGGQINLFKNFEREFIKNKLTFKQLGYNVSIYKNYQKIKRIFFENLIYKIAKRQELKEKEITAIYILLQKGDVKLENLKLSTNLKVTIRKKEKIISGYAQRKVVKMLRLKKSTAVDKEFIEKFFKNLELIDFSQKASISPKNFLKATFFYHEIIQNEDLGVKKSLLEKFYEAMKAGNINLAQLPLTL